MNLNKSKKYIIMGVAHCGTNSLEKYMVMQGYDVIRTETAYRARTINHYNQLWSDRVPIFLVSQKTHHSDRDYIKKYWNPINPIVLELDDLKKDDPKFPWENKEGALKFYRPDYHKLMEEGKLDDEPLSAKHR